MGDRYEHIEDAYRKTFEWAFLGKDTVDPVPNLTTEKLESCGRDGFTRAEHCTKDLSNVPGEHTRWSKFSHWLCGNEGMYWITGKPGSGKSTLMKYLYNEEQTLKFLHEWAGDYPLVTAGFFFWNSGTAMQMSKMGLGQALLHESINGQADLVPALFPDRWRSYELFGGDVHPWSWGELSQALEILISDTSKRYCFFIDGLDEFDGECSELANFTLEMSARPNVKLCVASRPWLVFEDAFQRRPSLRLEDLTANDIQLFTSEKLRGSSMFSYLERLQPDEAKSLIAEVTGKASGVFLWVRLVIASLLEGLRDGDTIADLHGRLLLLPSDLEQLFLKILNSLNPTYFEQASKLFQCVRVAQTPPSLLTLSFAEDGLDAAIAAGRKALSFEESTFRAELMRRRLSSRCKGLLEAPADKDQSVIAKVQYLHRTVKDFLNSAKIWGHITSGTPASYDPDLMLCGAFLLEVKSMNLEREKLFVLKDYLIQFILLCEKIQSKARDLHISSLNELDRVMEQLFQSNYEFWGKDRGSYIHWSSILDQRGPLMESFISLLGVHCIPTWRAN
jgi:hypothetical protein